MKNLKITRKNDTVTLGEMKDGDLAEVVKWHDEGRIGKLIRLARDKVELIGGDSGSDYTTLFDSFTALDGSCMVRIIQPGDTVEFTL